MKDIDNYIQEKLYIGKDYSATFKDFDAFLKYLMDNGVDYGLTEKKVKSFDRYEFFTKIGKYPYLYVWVKNKKPDWIIIGNMIKSDKKLIEVEVEENHIENYDGEKLGFRFIKKKIDILPNDDEEHYVVSLTYGNADKIIDIIKHGID